MLITAEIRWFWPDDGSTSRFDWFVSSQRHGGPPAEPAARVDRYLVDGVQPELGIKLRGGRSGVEIKGLVDARAAVLSNPPFDGAIEIWSKWWTVDIGLDAGRTVEVEKRRWVRAFDSTGQKPVEVSELVPAWYLGTAEMPARGCNVEVTRVAGPEGEVWRSDLSLLTRSGPILEAQFYLASNMCNGQTLQSAMVLADDIPFSWVSFPAEEKTQDFVWIFQWSFPVEAVV